MSYEDHAPRWAKRLFFYFFNLLPVSCQWFIWHLLRPTYLVGVYAVVLRKNRNGGNQVLLVDKRLGISSCLGINLPGGGITPGMTIEESTKAELRQETGITEVKLTLLQASVVEAYHDIHIVYWGHVEENSHFSPYPKPLDTNEISRAFWAPISYAEEKLPAKQRIMLHTAIRAMSE